MIDSLAKASLFVTKEYFVIALISIGYLTYNKPVFARALFLLLFTMTLTPFLKDIWQVPLNPALNKVGYAFPSGHMQATAVLWLWLAYELKKPLFTALAFLILGAVAFALTYLGYHTLIDIGGALGFACISLILYGAVTKVIPENKHSFLGIALALAALPLIYFTGGHQPHVWIAVGALSGFSVGWTLYHRWDSEQWLFKKRFKVACGLGGIVVFYGLTEFLEPYLSRESFNFIRFFSIAFWVSYGAEFCVYKLHKITKKL